MTKEQMWQEMVDSDIANDNEIQLVTSINGYTEETLLDILYVRTGFRNFEQWEESR